MSRYTKESPMDFEFQNGTGPLDGRSPFAQVSANSQRFPQGMNSPSKKRPYSHYHSPSKSRTMGAHPSSPEKRLPPTPAAYNTLFSTPRKPTNDIDDSSAGETPKSPEPNDSDATPENTNRTRALVNLDDANAQAISGAQRTRSSPTKERPPSQKRDSLLFQLAAKVKNKVYSPGRGEVPRKDHSGAIEKSVARRRRRDVDHRVARRRRHSMSDSGDEHDQPSLSPRKTSASQSSDALDSKPHWLSSLFTFIAQHPTLPATLSQYAQFLFNVFWLSVLAYMIYCFWAAVIGDVDEMSNKAMADIMGEIAACANQYKVNGCDQPTRVPAMESICADWEKCMSRDHRKVGRANVSARTFAQIFNSFVEPISYKAMIFSCILIFGCFAISNLAFGFFRHKMQEYQPPAYNYGAPPPTPQRSFSGQDGAFYAGTPWHQPPLGASFEPQPSGGFGQIEGRGSPQRRLAYN